MMAHSDVAPGLRPACRPQGRRYTSGCSVERPLLHRQECLCHTSNRAAISHFRRHAAVREHPDEFARTVVEAIGGGEGKGEKVTPHPIRARW